MERLPLKSPRFLAHPRAILGNLLQGLALVGELIRDRRFEGPALIFQRRQLPLQVGSLSAS